jgi:hypothetical protein
MDGLSSLQKTAVVSYIVRQSPKVARELFDYLQAELDIPGQASSIVCLYHGDRHNKKRRKQTVIGDPEGLCGSLQQADTESASMSPTFGGSSITDNPTIPGKMSCLYSQKTPQSHTPNFCPHTVVGKCRNCFTANLFACQSCRLKFSNGACFR